MSDLRNINLKRLTVKKLERLREGEEYCGREDADEDRLGFLLHVEKGNVASREPQVLFQLIREAIKSHRGAW